MSAPSWPSLATEPPWISDSCDGAPLGSIGLGLPGVSTRQKYVPSYHFDCARKTKLLTAIGAVLGSSWRTMSPFAVLMVAVYVAFLSMVILGAPVQVWFLRSQVTCTTGV